MDHRDSSGAQRLTPFAATQSGDTGGRLHGARGAAAASRGGSGLPHPGPDPFKFTQPGSLSPVLREADFRDLEETAQTVEWVWPGSPEEAWNIAVIAPRRFAPLLNESRKTSGKMLHANLPPPSAPTACRADMISKHVCASQQQTRFEISTPRQTSKKECQGSKS